MNLSLTVRINDNAASVDAVCWDSRKRRHRQIGSWESQSGTSAVTGYHGSFDPVRTSQGAGSRCNIPLSNKLTNHRGTHRIASSIGCQFSGITLKDRV